MIKMTLKIPLVFQCYGSVNGSITQINTALATSFVTKVLAFFSTTRQDLYCVLVESRPNRILKPSF